MVNIIIDHCFIIGIPIITIFINLIYGPGETWGHLVKNLLSDYLINSFFLIIGTSFFTLLFGVLSVLDSC